MKELETEVLALVNKLETTDPIECAYLELAYEKFRDRVYKEKQKILTKKPLWYKIFPYRIKLERVK